MLFRLVKKIKDLMVDRIRAAGQRGWGSGRR